MSINQPRWKEPEYTKREINDAGSIIRSTDSSTQEKEKALQIIDSWRGAHAYPMKHDLEIVKETLSQEIELRFRSSQQKS